MHNDIRNNSIWIISVAVGLLLGLYLISLYSYLLFHSLAEIFSIIVAYAIFIFAWNTRNTQKNYYFLFLGIVYFFIGAIDLVHTLGYTGMNIFPGTTTNLSTQLWIAARYMESLSLLIAFIFINRKFAEPAVIITYLSMTILLLLSIFVWSVFPDCFINGTGLTAFKKNSEYLICLLLCGSLVLLYHHRFRFDAYVYKLLQSALLFTIGAELAFTYYVSAYGLSNFVGHYFKIFSFFCIYKAVIETGLRQPYNLLFKELNEYKNELENRVEKRTAALVKSTNNLKNEIFERSKTEDALREREEQYRAVVNNSGVYIMRFDQKFRHIYANRDGLELSGLPKNQYLGKTHREIGFPEHLCELWEENIQIVFNTGKKQSVEFDMEFEKGSMSLELRLNPEFAPNGDVKTVIAISRDITNQKMAEKERNKLELRLQQAQRNELVGTMAGGIAHDFNNILVPIIGFAELSIQDLEDDDPITENLLDILQGAKRARDLVKQILTFSSRRGFDVEPLMLKPLIEEALKLLRSTIPSNIEIQQDLCKTQDYVMCNPTEIHEIVINLCTNAYHAIEKTNGIIIVSLTKIKIGPDFKLPKGEYNCLSISDDGMGIPSDIVSHIFDPYYTTKKDGKGTGLGLSVVHGIVINYKGIIKVKTTPGKGTVFDLYFPLTQKRESLIEVKPIFSKLSGNESILFVDDEETIVKFAVRLLERYEYTVTGKTNSVEALTLFESDPDRFDLVITDMAMPTMVGTKFAEKILKIRPDMPVILCTGYTQKAEYDMAKKIGISEVLNKPILAKELFQKVRKVIDHAKEESVFKSS